MKTAKRDEKWFGIPFAVFEARVERALAREQLKSAVASLVRDLKGDDPLAEKQKGG